MRSKVGEIGRSGLRYRVGLRNATSNSVIRTAIDTQGIAVEDAVPPAVPAEKLDGIGNSLGDEIDDARRQKLLREELNKGVRDGFPDHASKQPDPDPEDQSVSAGLLAAAARKKAALEEAAREKPAKAATAERFEDAPEALAEAAGARKDPPSTASSVTPPDGKRTPDVAAFVAEMTKEGGVGVADILAKGPLNVTDEEVRTVMAARQRAIAMGDPDADRLFRFEKAFFDQTFGSGPAEFDETGRMVEPEAIRAVPEKSADVATHDGEPMTTGLGRVAERIAANADKAGLPNAVRALQAGLNLLGQAAREKPETVAPRDRQVDVKQLAEAAPGQLKEDGRFGDKTRSGARAALAGFGIGRVNDALALGRFRNFAHDTRQDRAHEDVKSVTEEAFGPLFAGPNVPPGAVRHEAVALQETVNDLGARSADRPGGFEPLKLDGDIAEKTRDAFKRVATEKDPETVTRRMANRLGLIA